LHSYKRELRMHLPCVALIPLSLTSAEDHHREDAQACAFRLRKASFAGRGLDPSCVMSDGNGARAAAGDAGDWVP
jgi:hypothetical protein